jgi:hypothetical protein
VLQYFGLNAVSSLLLARRSPLSAGMLTQEAIKPISVKDWQGRLASLSKTLWQWLSELIITLET